MNYVLGIDLGTSAVKVLLLDQKGTIVGETKKPLRLLQEKTGYMEQDPDEWVKQSLAAIQEVLKESGIKKENVVGISYSGQMHGLILLNDKNQLIRNAILWNDTRTTQECKEIEEKLDDRLLQITKNPALEGFTLPKLLWVKRHEPQNYEKAKVFLLPKDYLRYRMTGRINSEYSDAAGTLLLNVSEKGWSKEICDSFNIDINLCPELIESHECVGSISREVADITGLSSKTKVFAGGADNACGAIGSGILSADQTLCSIGTSGVILNYEKEEYDYQGRVHFFNHGKEDAFYSMGVTLAAGDSLGWYKETFAPNTSYNDLMAGIDSVPPGANGLLFTPYIVGERTPHSDPNIRGSFIGMDRSHSAEHFTRAVVEGITFSLKESIEILRDSGKEIDHVISIGGGAKNPTWLQIQANIFNASIQSLENEQGPGLGAAMLAAYGCGWFSSLEESVKSFLEFGDIYYPNQAIVEKYNQIYQLYKEVYENTKGINSELRSLRS